MTAVEDTKVILVFFYCQKKVACLLDKYLHLEFQVRRYTPVLDNYFDQNILIESVWPLSDELMCHDLLQLIMGSAYQSVTGYPYVWWDFVAQKNSL